MKRPSALRFVPRFAPDRTILFAAALFACLAVLTQLRLGAYGAEFDFDESSHYVSGLLVRDFIAAARAQNPVAFLERFHESYPVVGIGHWGPFWYGVEGAWMLVLGPGRAAVLALSACVTALSATLLFAVARPRFGVALAVLAGAAFTLSPVIVVGTAAVMLDGGITLLAFLALLAWTRFAETGRARFAAAFGLLAGCALLIKGNAICLALLPPLLLALTWDWRAPLRPAFWLPVPIVAVLALPWYALTYDQVSAGFRFGWGWRFIATALPANLRILAAAFGPLALLAAALGVAARPARADRLMPACAALLLAVFAVQSVIPADIQPRYLAPAVPPLLLLAAAGLHRLAPKPRLAAIALVCAAALPAMADIAAKRRFGMIAAAEAVWAHLPPGNPSVLIVADGAAEPAAVAELAMRDPARPSLFAVRASRLLGGGGYNTSEYQPRYASAEQAAAAIDDYAIPLVILRGGAANGWIHVAQVEDTAHLSSDRWRPIFADGEGGAPVTLFELAGNDTRPADPPRLRALSAPKHLGGH